MVSLRPDVSICHNANSENKCQQLLTLPFVSILIFLIRYLSVEISRLTTVSIFYSGPLPVVMKNGLQLSALVLSLVRFKVDEYCQAWTRLTIPRKQITIWHMRQKWQSSNWVNTNMTYCKYTNEKETKYKAKETRYKMVIYKMMIHKMKNLKRTQRRQIAKLLSQWKFYILLSVQPGCL